MPFIITIDGIVRGEMTDEQYANVQTSIIRGTLMSRDIKVNWRTQASAYHLLCLHLFLKSPNAKVPVTMEYTDALHDSRDQRGSS